MLWIKNGFEEDGLEGMRMLVNAALLTFYAAVVGFATAGLVGCTQFQTSRAQLLKEAREAAEPGDRPLVTTRTEISYEDIYTDSGFGVTIWKIPIVGLGFWGGGGMYGVPPVIIHKYDYRAPPSILPGASPLPPTVQNRNSAVAESDTADVPALPQVYKQIYGSGFEDPTLVVFINESYYDAFVEIGEEDPIFLSPYQATKNLHLGLGKHKIKITIVRPTRAHGEFEIVRFLDIRIHPRGRGHIIRIYE